MQRRKSPLVPEGLEIRQLPRIDQAFGGAEIRTIKAQHQHPVLLDTGRGLKSSRRPQQIHNRTRASNRMSRGQKRRKE